MAANSTNPPRSRVMPEPDFTDSRQLRIALNNARRSLHRAAMEVHVYASELEAALMTIPVVDGHALTSRSVQRRRARRVSRHIKHGAECLVAGSSAMVRCWGEFRAQYAPETAPVRGRRQPFKVVPE